MISYELAKQLKDAGFSQGTYMHYTCQHDEPLKCRLVSFKLHESDCDDVAVPTLEELIDACGDEFGRLIRQFQIGGIFWTAYSSPRPNDINVPAYIVQIGSTPTEAVANLYLALKKK